MTEQTLTTPTIGQELLSVIEGIDENLFCTELFENDKGQRCVIGHYNHVKHNNAKHFEGHHKNEDPIRIATANFFQKKYGVVSINGIAWINNFNTFPPYTEESIKARVVHAIKDMIDFGF